MKKVGLKLNIKKSKRVASGPITSWQIEGENVKAVTDFIFLGSKITADSDFSLEIKRHLLIGRKAMTKLDRVLKSRDITLLTKVCVVKTMIFPEYSLEGLMLKLKLPYFGHLMQRADSLEKICDAGEN